MRATSNRRVVLGALLCLAAVLGPPCSLAAASKRVLLRSIAPRAVPHGPSSPFKLAHSAAHGIVSRRQGALRIAPGFSPFASELCSASCAPPLLYHNGAVMHKVKVYVIQWEPPTPSSNGQSGTSFPALPSSYRTEVGEFLQKVAAASGTLGNVYSTDALYGETATGGGGAYDTEFGEVLRDEDPYPARKTSTCPVPSSAEKFYPPAGSPCISDGESETGEQNFQLSEELFSFLQKHPSLPVGLGAMYFLITPHEVNSCSGFQGGIAACNTNFYCAYHSGFGVENSKHEVFPVIYANMPYNDVPGCETPDQPHKSPADDEINTLSHEHNEAVTDPLGEGWWDSQGEEIGDKCTYPFFNPGEDSSPSSDAYGVLLGGTPKGGTGITGTAFNQEIGGGQYLLQREWSNVAGGCVARAPGVKASFVMSQQSETEFAFNGGPSTTEAGEIVEYKWEFSNEAGSKSGANVTQSFVVPGTYTVKLTVKNNSGSVSTSEQEITLKAGGGGFVTSTTTTTTTQTSTTTRTSTTTQTTTTTEPAVTTTTTSSVTFTAPPLVTTSTVTASNGTTASASRHSAAEIASLLGLPAAGAKLAGLGSISLGHAKCPPACGVTAQILATVQEGKRVKHLQIGSLSEKISEGGAGSISLKLTSKGQKLLHKTHSLHVALVVGVEDSAGGNWTIERRLTLTSGGKAARRASRRR